jgi:proteasome lid subunit RPN8/RPN11
MPDRAPTEFMPPVTADALIVPRGVLSDIAAHAREEAPNECCGLLLGEWPRVDAGVRAKNLRAGLRYLIDPRDQFDALKLARSRGLTIIGAYHSHPDAPAVPSRTDLAEALDPALIHLIVTPESGLRAAEIRAWRLEQGLAHEVRVVPVD